MTQIDQNITLSPDTDFETVIDRIGVGEDEQLRTSRRRESYLRKFARVTSRSDIPLMLNPVMNCTSYTDDIEQTLGLENITNENDEIILVSTTMPEQTQTNLSRKLYDLVFQEFVTTHEVGHVLFSDFETLKDVSDNRLDDEDFALFTDLFDPLEDGAIEAELSDRYNIEEEMKLARSNVAATLQFGIQTEKDKVAYTAHDACRTALYDMAAYNSGRSDMILDDQNENHVMWPGDTEIFKDMIPKLKTLVADFLSEPDGGQRVEILYDWFIDNYQDLEDRCDVQFKEQVRNRRQNSDPSNRGQINDEKEIGYVGDAENMVGQGVQQGEMAGQQSESKRSPDREEIEEALEEDDDDGIGSYAGDLEDYEDEIEDSGDSQGDQQKDSGSMTELERRLREKYQREMRREAEQAAGDSLEELEKLHDAIGASDGDLRSLEVLKDDQGGDLEKWRTCEVQGRQLARRLRERLRHKKASHPQRNKRRGRFDSKRMTAASQGSPRVFTQEQKEHELDYQFMIVPDRSGSMSGNVDALEEAVGSLAFALQECKIDCSIIDLEGYTPKVTLPFGFDAKDRSGVITRGGTGGGTPMADMVRLAQKRLEMQAETNPVMVIITDDCPSNPEDYKNAVDNVNFPVVGISIKGDGGYGNQNDFSHLFDRHVQVEPNDPTDLRNKLRMLVEEIVL